MPPAPSQVSRRVGMTLFLAFVALIVVGVIVKEPWPNDFTYLMVRWPYWVVPALFVPFVIVRLALWPRRRGRRAGRKR